MMISFNMDNAAFTENTIGEVRSVFERITYLVDQGYEDGKVFDSNGNSIGNWSVVE